MKTIADNTYFKLNNLLMVNYNIQWHNKRRLPNTIAYTYIYLLYLF